MCNTDCNNMSSFPLPRFSPEQDLAQGPEIQEPAHQPLQAPQHQPPHPSLQEPPHQLLQELHGQPVQHYPLLQPEHRQLLLQLLRIPPGDLPRLLQPYQNRVLIDNHHMELFGFPACAFGIAGGMAGAYMIYKLANSEKFVDAICDSITAVSGAIVRRITKGSIKLEVIAETKEISNCLVEACKSGKLVKDLNQRISACGSDTNEMVYEFDDVQIIATTSIEITSEDLEKEKIQSRKNIEEFKHELVKRFEKSQEMKSASLTPEGTQLSDKLKAENQGKESRKSPSEQEIVQQIQQMFKGEARLKTKLKEDPKLERQFKRFLQLVQDYRSNHRWFANEILKSLGWAPEIKKTKSTSLFIQPEFIINDCINT